VGVFYYHRRSGRRGQWALGKSQPSHFAFIRLFRSCSHANSKNRSAEHNKNQMILIMNMVINQSDNNNQIAIERFLIIYILQLHSGGMVKRTET
jgi:hypothetical protein